MRGARNGFCVVVLADHRRLAPQSTGHRRLACLECINHVHLQRTGKERDEEKGEREREKGEATGKHQNGQHSEWLKHLLLKKQNVKTPLNFDLKHKG